MTMKRILVIGCPESGKTVFAKRLKRKTGLPLYHLDDMMFWRRGRHTMINNKGYVRLSETLEKDEWILDGHYDYTLEERFERCDTVFFLDIPSDFCLERKRKQYGGRDFGEYERVLKERFEAYDTEYRPHAYELLEEYKDKNIIIFRSYREMKRYKIISKRPRLSIFR